MSLEGFFSFHTRNRRLFKSDDGFVLNFAHGFAQGLAQSSYALLSVCASLATYLESNDLRLDRSIALRFSNHNTMAQTCASNVDVKTHEVSL